MDKYRENVLVVAPDNPGPDQRSAAVTKRGLWNVTLNTATHCTWTLVTEWKIAWAVVEKQKQVLH